MRNVGDYEWIQVSRFKSTPDKCIEKYVTASSVLSGDVTCLFYLVKVIESSENSWKTAVIEDVTDVPNEVLNWRNSEYSVKFGETQ